MSESTVKPSTTKDSQGLTQGENKLLSNLNFSIVCNFSISADPSLIEAVEKVASCLELLRTPKLPEVAEYIEKIPVINKVPVIEKIPVKHTTGRKPDHDWIKVDNNLKYAIEGARIFVNYSGNNVETTKKEVERLLMCPIEDRTIEVREICGDNKNKRNALYSFLKFYETKFKNEDPDAAFKPMLSSYSTRPMGDCGKADDNLEG